MGTKGEKDMPDARKPFTNAKPPECWACGVRCPRRTHVRKIGWMQRAFRVVNGYERETYCPDCFAEWGWPPESPVVEASK